MNALRNFFFRLSPKDDRKLFTGVLKEIYDLLEQNGAFDDDIEVSDEDTKIIVKQINKIYRDYRRQIKSSEK